MALLHTFYLAGPIWKIGETEKDWRKDLSEQLNKLGYKTLDPTKKQNEKYKGETVTDVIEYRRKFGFYAQQTTNFIDWIFNEDLKMIDSADAIIAYLPKHIPSFGTAQELFYNYYFLKRDNFIITDMDLVTNVSVFLQKTTKKFFSSIDDFLYFIQDDGYK